MLPYVIYSHPTIAEHPQLRNTLVQFRKYLSSMNFSDDETILGYNLNCFLAILVQ